MIFLLLALLAPPAAAESPLSIAAHYTRYAGDCAQIVKLEHAQSFPIPVKTPEGLRYRVLYYPEVDDQAYAPAAVAQFDLKGEATCRVRVALPAADLQAPLGPELTAKAAAMSRDKYEAKTAKLYAALERVSAAYDSGKADKSAAADFQDLFATLSEPALKPYYRALSPEFWAWLEKK